MNQPVWLIEAKDEENGEWYPCWYEVYYSKSDSISNLKTLLNGDHGFTLGRKNYRTKKYVRQNAN